MSSKILIVDDDSETADILHRLLIVDGYSIFFARNVDEAKSQAKTHDIDLVLLDLNLSQMTEGKNADFVKLIGNDFVGQEGFEIAAWLRDTYPDIRVIFLSSKHDIEHRVRGLDLGGDDYISKPFNATELRARIRSTLRRSGKSSSPTFVFGKWHFDTKSNRISHMNNPNMPGINLSLAEGKILYALLEANGETVSRESLSKRAFGRPITTYDRAVDTSISKLRAKLNDERGAANQIVETVHGFGYRIIQK